MTIASVKENRTTPASIWAAPRAFCAAGREIAVTVTKFLYAYVWVLPAAQQLGVHTPESANKCANSIPITNAIFATLESDYGIGRQPGSIKIRLTNTAQPRYSAAAFSMVRRQSSGRLLSGVKSRSAIHSGRLYCRMWLFT